MTTKRRSYERFCSSALSLSLSRHFPIPCSSYLSIHRIIYHHTILPIMLHFNAMAHTSPPSRVSLFFSAPIQRLFLQYSHLHSPLLIYAAFQMVLLSAQADLIIVCGVGTSHVAMSTAPVAYSPWKDLSCVESLPQSLLFIVHTHSHRSFIHFFELCNARLMDLTCRTCGFKTHSPKEPWRPFRRISSTSGGETYGFLSLFQAPCP